MLKEKLNLFRQAALENIEAPDKLDTLVSVTSPQQWLVLYTLSFALFCLLLWGFFGSIPTRVLGQGILLATEGSVYNVPAPAGNSKIVKITVKTGQFVHKNQPVAELDQPDLTQQIKTKQAYLNELKQKFQQLNQQKLLESEKYKIQNTDKNQRLEKMIAIQTENLSHQEEIIKIREYALKRGIDTKLGVNVALKELADTKREIEQAKSQLAQNKIDAANFADQWEERLRNLDLKLKDEEYEYNRLIGSAKTARIAVSPIDGVVSSIRYNMGDAVKEGDTLANIAVLGKGMDAVVFIPAENGKRVEQNMDALVEPSTVKKEEFGSIKGKVISVAEYPSSSESMMTILQNKDLVEQFTQKKTQIAVRIKLLSNPATFSKLAWTSSQGPHYIITPGTLVSSSITVRKQAPITLILPALRKLLSDW